MSLKLISGDEFLATQPDKMPWVIPPLCGRGSSVMLYGRQKVGKSSAIVQLIHSLTTGEPWLGFPVMQTGPVIYLQLDMAKAEMWRVIKRGEKCGFNVRKDVYLPDISADQQAIKFDIFDPTCRTELQAWCEEIKPLAVIVDTINDAYSSQKNDNINLFIREIHRHFRDSIGDAVLFFLNHTRKEVQNKYAKKSDEDEPDQDGYLGGGGWAQVTSAILELYKHKKPPYKRELVVHDLRLDAFPGKRMVLQVSDHGFFSNAFNSQQMLLFWPYCLPKGEQSEALEKAKSRNDVFRDIAARTGSTFDAVKKQFQRAKDVEFLWTDLFTQEEGEDE